MIRKMAVVIKIITIIIMATQNDELITQTQTKKQTKRFTKMNEIDKKIK